MVIHTQVPNWKEWDVLVVYGDLSEKHVDTQKKNFHVRKHGENIVITHKECLQLTTPYLHKP